MGKEEKASERVAWSLAGVVLAVTTCYLISLCAGRRGTGILKMLRTALIHIGVIKASVNLEKVHGLARRIRSKVPNAELDNTDFHSNLTDETMIGHFDDDDDDDTQGFVGHGSSFRLRGKDWWAKRAGVCGRRGPFAKFCDSKAPRKIAACSGWMAFFVLCIAASGLSYGYTTLTRFNWATLIAIPNGTVCNRSLYDELHHNLSLCEDRQSQGEKMFHSLPIIGDIAHSVSDDGGCDWIQAMHNRESKRLIREVGAELWVGLNRIAERTVDGEERVFKFTDANCSLALGEAACERCHESLPGFFLVLLGIYAQFIGAWFAIIRLRDKMNGLGLHLMASLAGLLAFAAVNTTPVLFDLHCYAVLVESPNMLHAEHGNARKLTRAAAVATLCQFIAHCLAQHDPTVPCLEGTPWKWLFGTEGLCCEASTDRDDDDDDDDDDESAAANDEKEGEDAARKEPGRFSTVGHRYSETKLSRSRTNPEIVSDSDDPGPESPTPSLTSTGPKKLISAARAVVTTAGAVVGKAGAAVTTAADFATGGWLRRESKDAEYTSLSNALLVDDELHAAAVASPPRDRSQSENWLSGTKPATPASAAPPTSQPVAAAVGSYTGPSPESIPYRGRSTSEGDKEHMMPSNTKLMKAISNELLAAELGGVESERSPSKGSPLKPDGSTGAVAEHASPVRSRSAGLPTLGGARVLEKLVEMSPDRPLVKTKGITNNPSFLPSPSPSASASPVGSRRNSANMLASVAAASPPSANPSTTSFNEPEVLEAAHILEPVSSFVGTSASESESETAVRLRRESSEKLQVRPGIQLDADEKGIRPMSVARANPLFAQEPAPAPVAGAGAGVGAGGGGGDSNYLEVAGGSAEAGGTGMPVSPTPRKRRPPPQLSPAGRARAKRGSDGGQVRDSTLSLLSDDGGNGAASSTDPVAVAAAMPPALTAADKDAIASIISFPDGNRPSSTDAAASMWTPDSGAEEDDGVPAATSSGPAATSSGPNANGGVANANGVFSI